MIVSEIHKAFKVQMDKNAEAVSFGGCPAFLPEEIDLFLNQAYNEVILNKFTGNNVLRTPFEGNLKRIEDLQGLVVTDSIEYSTRSMPLSENPGKANNVIVCPYTDFTEGNGIFIVLDCKIGHIKDNYDIETCRIVDHETFRKFEVTKHNYPWIDYPVSMIESNSIFIAFDPETITLGDMVTVVVTYITKPTIIDYKNSQQNITEVSDNVWYEVINRAVVLALENIESQRSQTKVQLNNLSE